MKPKIPSQTLKKSLFKERKGQLFVFEVIISLALIITLIFFIFSIATQNQTILEQHTEPINQIRSNVLQTLRDMHETHVLDAYITQANQTYYATSSYLSPFQENKSKVLVNLNTAVTEVYQYSLALYRNASNSWIKVDSFNENSPAPSGSASISIDYFIMTLTNFPSPTYAVHDTFRIYIIIWEVA